jgi:hypothetical protein
VAAGAVAPRTPGQGPLGEEQARSVRAAARISPPKLLIDEGSVGKLPTSVAENWMAQSRGKNARHPIELYREQPRNEEWAGAMEGQLNARFSAERLTPLGLTTMKLDEVDCRESSCRLEISWGDADLEAAKNNWKAPERWPDAAVYLTTNTGGLAYVETRVRPKLGEVVIPDAWHVSRRPDGRYAVTTVLLFGPEDIDPTKYTQVIERAFANRRRL